MREGKGNGGLWRGCRYAKAESLRNPTRQWALACRDPNDESGGAGGPGQPLRPMELRRESPDTGKQLGAERAGHSDDTRTT
jgi:hypothetical protein